VDECKPLPVALLLQLLLLLLLLILLLHLRIRPARCCSKDDAPKLRTLISIVECQQRDV
jgi:hypothetical protein